MFFIGLQRNETCFIILLMKFFVIALLLFGSTVLAADEPEMLTCPREEDFQGKIDEKRSEWCAADRFNEAANELFEFETNEYRDKYLTPLLQDNVHDVRWLVSKSTQDIRRHTYCFELICETIQAECADNKNYQKTQAQSEWCKTRATAFGEIEQMKAEQVLIENQKRKSRSNLREKMRAMEVRTSNLFLPLVQKFFAEYRWFTEKVPTFLRNPL